MLSVQTQLLVSYLGLLAQTATAVLISVLLMLLRREHREHVFFHRWCMAWLALSTALLALVVGLHATVNIGADLHPARLTLLFTVYLVGKFAFYLLLVAGTLQFAGVETAKHQRQLQLVSGSLLLFALVLPWYQADLNVLVQFQAPAACIAGFICAYLLWRRQSLRSFGSRYCMMMFLAMSALWFLYGLAFTAQQNLSPERVSLLVEFTHYNSYFDLIVQQLLAFGFVVLLLEQVRRETEVAHVKLRMAHEKLKDVALHDQLTGAGNRLALHAYRRGDAADCTLISCDLDFLKPVNDQYGHEAGDQLLAHFVAVLRQGLCDSGSIFRVGGDEFVVILSTSKPEDALQKMRALLTQSPSLFWQQQPLQLQASLGAVNWSRDADLETTMRLADQLMYQDKRNGKSKSDRTPIDRLH